MHNTEKSGPKRSTPPSYGRNNFGAGATTDQFDLALAATPLRAVVAMFIVSLLATGAYGVFAVKANRDQDQFAHAPNCAVSTPVGGCLGMVNVTIQDKTTNGGKNPSYWLDLSGPTPADGQVTMVAQYPVWNEVSVGDQASATIWHGQVVAITDYIDTEHTSDAPAIDVVLYDGLSLAAFMWAATFALFAFRGRALRDGMAHNWTRVVVPFHAALVLGGVGLVFGACLTAVDGYSLGWDLGLGVVFAAIGEMCTAWSVWRHR